MVPTLTVIPSDKFVISHATYANFICHLFDCIPACLKTVSGMSFYPVTSADIVIPPFRPTHSEPSGSPVSILKANSQFLASSTSVSAVVEFSWAISSSPAK